MKDYKVKIENPETSITISDFKCVDCVGDPKLHLSFALNIDSLGCKFSAIFTEMVVYQFDFKQDENEIVDENHIEKRLIIKRDEISFELNKYEKEFNEVGVNFVFKFSPEKIEDFKIELKTYVNAVLCRS